MTYKAESVPFTARTNSDFNATITLEYSTTNLTILFKVKKQNGSIIDLSSYVTKSNNSLSISIPASKLLSIGAGRVSYDIVVDNGNGSREMIVGGYITIEEGISWQYILI